VKRISLSKNILRALENNNEIPELGLYPKAHQVKCFWHDSEPRSDKPNKVTFRYYLGMLSFLNEDYSKVSIP
jgi:COP9 signalosome complex subunit 12